MSALEQGDIIEVDFIPAVGHEPAKRRPAVVVSAFAHNTRSSLVMAVPITSSDTGYPLHVPVTADGVSGFAAVEALRSLDVGQRSYRLLGYADGKAMRTIMSFIRGIFDLR